MGTNAVATSTGTARRGGTLPRARADAARNHERIVDAAREAFVVYGADAPLDDIARRAGVGNATLYRHFPDRHTLVHAVVLAVTERIAGRARASLGELASAAGEFPEPHGSEPHGTGGAGEGAGEAADTGAFAALRRFVLGAVEEQVGALCPMLSRDFDRQDAELLAAKAALDELLAELIERAQGAGELRHDIGPGDVMVALSQLTRPLPGVGCAEIAHFADRHVRLYLDGLRAPARSELPWHAATLEELRTHT